ncbi:hypothetical protein MMC14_010560 [Varicellaria rhodocarpa]|nr:hypothetical protein [Varicellaria rhodocarpa]
MDKLRPFEQHRQPPATYQLAEGRCMQSTDRKQMPDRDRRPAAPEGKQLEGKRKFTLESSVLPSEIILMLAPSQPMVLPHSLITKMLHPEHKPRQTSKRGKAMVKALCLF